MVVVGEPRLHPPSCLSTTRGAVAPASSILTRHEASLQRFVVGYVVYVVGLHETNRSYHPVLFRLGYKNLPFYVVLLYREPEENFLTFGTVGTGV